MMSWTVMQDQTLPGENKTQSAKQTPEITLSWVKFRLTRRRSVVSFWCTKITSTTQ